MRGVLTAISFDPKVTVIANYKKISLLSYTARMNIQLLKAADFNEKPRKREVDERVTTRAHVAHAREKLSQGKLEDADKELKNLEKHLK